MKNKMVILGLLVVMGCACLIPLKVGPPRDIAVEITPERLTRGEYLAKHVTRCVYCHSGLDWNYYAGGLPKPGTEGGGGWHETVNEGLIGSYDLYFPNITPAAIGNWTDGELIRAMTEGVSKDGKPLFPIMPYERFRIMDKEDVYSIVVYIRSLDPISNTYPKKKVKRLFKFIERSVPKPWEPQTQLDPSNSVAYGKYLSTIGDCVACHSTMTNTAQFIEGMDFAGGNEYIIPNGGIVRSANITPDLETGIGNRSKDNFIGLFKAFQEPIQLPEDSKHGNTVMAWTAFAGMTVEDLGAIYDYLRTVKPVKNRVEKYPGDEVSNE
ncbi:MAG: c-type cytochrome [Candidatus Marinimicrobia bacterium]|nr:c-type cytochrome [Candidatus Neomarinimicrobiota bacterium]